MNRIHLFAAALIPVLAVCGCSSMNNTEAGAGAGGLIGAGTGALIGSATGHTGAGALIGAGVGAVSGGLIGHAVDKSEERTAAQIAAANPRGSMGLIDVVQLTQARASDDVIIAQIRTTASVFRLSSADTIYLKQQGVSDAVITEMLATATRYPPTVAVPVYGPPVYADPPPVSVGVGFGYYGRRW